MHIRRNQCSAHAYPQEDAIRLWVLVTRCMMPCVPYHLIACMSSMSMHVQGLQTGLRFGSFAFKGAAALAGALGREAGRAMEKLDADAKARAQERVRVSSLCRPLCYCGQATAPLLNALCCKACPTCQAHAWMYVSAMQACISQESKAAEAEQLACMVSRSWCKTAWRPRSDERQLLNNNQAVRSCSLRHGVRRLMPAHAGEGAGCHAGL